MLQADVDLIMIVRSSLVHTYHHSIMDAHLDDVLQLRTR
jgi:hypothetical protein